MIALAQALAGVDPQTHLVRRGARHRHAARRPDRDRGADPGVPRRRSAERGFCAIGSVKSNIGHLDAAAGVAGLIKTALALAPQDAPAEPALHRAEPEARPRGHAVLVVTDLATVAVARGSAAPRRRQLVRRRRHQRPRRPRGGAAAPARPAPTTPSSSSSSRPGRRPRSTRPRRACATTSSTHPADPLADVAYTLQAGRRRFSHRRARRRRGPRTPSSGSARRIRQRRSPASSTRRGRARSPSCSRARARSTWAWRAALYDARAGFRADVDECCGGLAPAARPRPARRALSRAGRRRAARSSGSRRPRSPSRRCSSSSTRSRWRGAGWESSPTA